MCDKSSLLSARPLICTCILSVYVYVNRLITFIYCFLNLHIVPVSQAENPIALD